MDIYVLAILSVFTLLSGVFSVLALKESSYQYIDFPDMAFIAVVCLICVAGIVGGQEYLVQSSVHIPGGQNETGWTRMFILTQSVSCS